MSQSFGCLILFLFFLVFAIVQAVMNMVHILFPFTNRQKNGRTGQNRDRQRQEPHGTGGAQRPNDTRMGGASAKSKIFEDNEGEYVDFEEIKD